MVRKEEAGFGVRKLECYFDNSNDNKKTAVSTTQVRDFPFTNSQEPNVSFYPYVPAGLRG